MLTTKPSAFHDVLSVGLKGEGGIAVLIVGDAGLGQPLGASACADGALAMDFGIRATIAISPGNVFAITGIEVYADTIATTRIIRDDDA